MDRLRREGADMPTDGTPPREGQADFAIGGAGDRTEQVGRDHCDLVTRSAQFGDRRLQRAADPVDLRLPGLADNPDSHAVRAGEGRYSAAGPARDATSSDPIRC